MRKHIWTILKFIGAIMAFAALLALISLIMGIVVNIAANDSSPIALVHIAVFLGLIMIIVSILIKVSQ